jgi:hypothetical protein
MWRHRGKLKALAKAETVAFGPVGIAGTVLPATQAYDDLVEAGRGDPAGLVPRLEKLLREATPAGKIYAAEAIDRINPVAGRRAWERLAGETGEFMTLNGCVGGRSTLAGYASGRLSRTPPPGR